MRHDRNLLSLAAAAGAGALFMYYLDSKRGRQPAQSVAARTTGRIKRMAARLRGSAASAEAIEHGREPPLATRETPHAHDSWTEQGV